MTAGERCWWGWGTLDAHLNDEALDALAAELGSRFDAPFGRTAARTVSDLTLPASRVQPPASLTDVTDDTAHARAIHSHGQAYRDVVRAFHGEITAFPDLVALPRDASDVARILDWCAETGTVCVPFGGGTSVVGGVDPPEDRPSVALDLGRLAGVVDLDRTSRSARVAAGTFGPRIDADLRPHGFALRHYPQSWEFSTLGGWIATRAGGHYATLATRIDDLVEAITAVTPAGTWESRRLPSSGAGPDPARLLLGSEGILGVITEAWLRVQPRPRFRATADVTFPTFAAGCEAVRVLAQSDLHPSNCRLLDPTEALLAGAGDGSAAVLVLGFETADHPLDAWLDRALELTGDHGGTTGSRHLRDDEATDGPAGAGGAWRRAFLQAPYLRDAVVAIGGLAETFETATTWDRLHDLNDELLATARRVATEVCGAAIVSIRLTHAYPDGAAPYLTVVAPSRRGSEVAQWDAIKEAVSEVIGASGATITHHHAVGRTHRPGYDRERPDPFAAALTAAKRALDPAGIMNPGVLID